MRLFLTTITIFTVIFLAIICVKLLSTLEIHYNRFYKQNRRFIVSMTTSLVVSNFFRVLNIIWKQKIGARFYEIMDSDGATNGWFFPTYLTLHFFLVDFISSGALLLNFGFTVKNKKQVVEIEKEDEMGTKRMTRRETFLNLEDSDEEEGCSGLYVDTCSKEGNPFQIKAGHKLDRSPIDVSPGGADASPDYGGRFKFFHRFSRG
jgi:hypothetical protein